jgi:2-hydroxychromene-2-carboxylate isomerase
MNGLDFWFDFASTYSFLTAARIRSLADQAGAAVRWRPFLLGPIFAAQGWTDSPFNLYPVKGSYMWRDMERQCARLGLALRRPSVFPRNSVLAARVALVADDPDFVVAVYKANFCEDREISDAAVIAEILADLGKPSELLEAAQSPENKGRLRAETEEAMRLGIFGAPSFIAAGELYWGNDRLEQALQSLQPLISFS